MRSLKLAAALALAAWLVGSFAQQEAPPAPPPGDRPPSSTPAPPPEEQENPPPRTPREDEPDDIFVPTEELQPDAAVTFPVDI